MGNEDNGNPVETSCVPPVPKKMEVVLDENAAMLL
jgi:hypothetical protein